MNAYRLYEERDGKLYPLQHKTGTPVEPGVWHEADVKLARDGSGNRWYKAGFHSVPSVADAVAYMQHFGPVRRARLRVCRVTVADTWRKEHSPAPVILSRWLKLETIVIGGR